MKRICLVVLSIVLMVSLMVGCLPKVDDSKESAESDHVQSKVDSTEKDKEESSVPDYLNLEGFPIVKEPIVLNGLAAIHVTHKPWEEIWFWQEMEKRTGIDFQWELDEQNVFVEKRNIKTASGQLPDFYFRAMLSSADEALYANQGHIISLNDLIDQYAPNIKALFEKDPTIKKAITQTDGKIYALPQVKYDDYNGKLVGGVSGKLYMRKDWLKTLNMKEPRTLDEYLEVLRAIKTNDCNGNGDPNDEVPLICSEIGKSGTMYGFLIALRGSFGLGTRGNNNDQYFDIDKNGELRFIPIANEYKELLQFAHTLYAEGLLDKEFFTNKTSNVRNKAKKDLIGSFFSGNPTNVYANLYGKDDELRSMITVLPQLVGPYGDHVFSNAKSTIASTGTFAISKTNKYPEATIRMIDYLYSEEGSSLLRNGQEGIHYDENHIRLVDKNDYGQYFIRAGGAIPHVIYDEEEVSFHPESVRELKSYDRTIISDDIPDILWSDFFYTSDEMKIMNSKYVDIKTLVIEKMAAYIMDGDFSDWDDYVALIKRMGLEDVMEVVDRSLERTGYEK